MIAFVTACPTCRQCKASTLSLGGLLQPIPLPTDDITMDFVEGLPRSARHDSILVVVDRLSKYAHFLGLRHPFSANLVATIFVKEIVRLHGFPQTIISDRDRVFLSHFSHELFKL